jgi:hypothetical protein
VNPFIAYHKQAELATRARNRPLATRYGQGYGVQAAVYAMAQVVVATTVAAGHQGALIALLHVSDPTSGIVFSQAVWYPIITSIASCLIFGIVSMVISYYAAFQAAHATRNSALGRRAGIIAQLLGTAAWGVFGLIGAFVSGTDGFLLTTNPFQPSAIPSQMEGIVLLVIARTLVIGGLGFLPALFFLNIGAQEGRSRMP